MHSKKMTTDKNKTMRKCVLIIHNKSFSLNKKCKKEKERTLL